VLKLLPQLTPNITLHSISSVHNVKQDVRFVHPNIHVLNVYQDISGINLQSQAINKHLLNIAPV